MFFKINEVSTYEELKSTYTLFQEIFEGMPIVNNPEYSLERWKERMISHGDLMLYASLNVLTTGLVFGRVNGDSITIGPVVVKEEYRGCGLASQLMLELEKRASNYDVKSLVLGAADSAHGFYKKLGYQGALLIQSQDNSVNELMTLKHDYEVEFTNVYDNKVSQVCLKMDDADADLQNKIKIIFPKSYTMMMFKKDL